MGGGGKGGGAAFVPPQTPPPAPAPAPEPTEKRPAAEVEAARRRKEELKSGVSLEENTTSQKTLLGE